MVTEFFQRFKPKPEPISILYDPHYEAVEVHLPILIAYLIILGQLDT